MAINSQNISVELIKKLVVVALTSDEVFMGLLVLKGGNALQLGYEITDRVSIDIDFSIEGDFSESDLNRMKNMSADLLNHYFEPAGLHVFDIKFENKPSVPNKEIKDFWGGYSLSFKVTELIKNKEPLEKLRREAIVIGPNQTKTFVVDISKYEYVADAAKKEIDGAIVRIYSPEMLAIEKLRALCQQVDSYKTIVPSITKKSRARDFYDINNLTVNFAIDPILPHNVTLTKEIFDAKRVPYNYFKNLPEYRDFHRNSWETVIQTLSVKEEVKGFDYYFDYVMDKYSPLFKVL